MKASALESRFRYLIHTIVYVLGLHDALEHMAAPRHGQNVAVACSVAFAYGLAQASPRQRRAVLVLGTLFALSGASLRTWAAAYLRVRRRAGLGDAWRPDGGSRAVSLHAKSSLPRNLHPPPLRRPC